MSGITSGIGLASGIDTNTLIERLISLESRPRTLAQQRLIQLQSQQAAYFDLNSRMTALKTAAAKFRTGKVFDTMRATSSAASVLTASASTAAQAGNYSFIVDRLVTSQQVLSRGFADKDNSALGVSSFTFENAIGRLDRDTNLSDLNGGEGADRGKIIITTAAGATNVDLSKAATVNEVLDAINGSGAGVTASVEGGAFVLRSADQTFTVANGPGSTTATSLGLATTTTPGQAAAGKLQGSNVYSLSADTALSSLNDGNGVSIGDDRSPPERDFTITVGTTVVHAYLGGKWAPDPANPTKLIQVEGAVSTLGQAMERINDALEAALGNTSVSVRINATTGVGLELVNQSTDQVVVENRYSGTPSNKRYTRSTATDLGLAALEAPTTYAASSTTSGARLLASMNSTLAKNLNGGAGIAVNGGGLGELAFTDRAGNAATVTFDRDASIEQIIRAINDQAPAAIAATLNAEGTGILITDTTATGAITSNLIIDGASAASLGLGTGLTGVAASKKDSDSLQHAYVTKATLVSELNDGKGIGLGKFRVTGPGGGTVTIDIAADTVTVGDLVSEIDAAIDDLGLRARINSKGDGIIIEEIAPTPGSQTIKIEDTTGAVAKALRIAGEAKGTGAQNFIDGSYETTVTFDPTDTLSEVVGKINSSGAGVSASILSSGASSKPYRISFSSKETGTAGRFILDTNGFDLGLDTLEAGSDARVFLGSTDPARAILLQSSTNTLDQIVSGVTIDLNATSEDPVQLTIARDTTAFETAVNDFVTAFNAVITRIDDQSKYDEASKRKGIFLGDGTAQGIRQNLFSSIQDDGTNLTGSFQFLTQIGIGFSGGKLSFNRERFRTALEEDFASVKEIFAAREQEVGDEFQQIPGLPAGVKVRVPQDQRGFTKLGVIGALEETLKDYVDTIDGSLTKRTESLGSQITLQQQRITFLTERLAARRGILQQQFVAMEQAISNLQAQGSVLGRIQAIG